MSAPSPLMASLHVALGGAIGSVLRYQLGRAMTHWLARHGEGGEPLRLFIGVGVLGGFTTFSAFSLELMVLAERGQAGQAFVYAAVSVLAGLSALYVGLIAMRVAG